MNHQRFLEENHNLPKMQLIEVFPLVPFLWDAGPIHSFDVGANTGIWSEAFLRTFGPRIAHHGMYEPLPGNFDILQRRKADYLDALSPRTVAHNKALGDTVGEAVLNFEKEVSTLASIANTESDIGPRVFALDKSVTVPVGTVDAEMAAAGLEVLHMLKADVEGFEMQVMKGAAQALADRRVRNIFFEFGGHQTRNGESFKDFYDFLTGHGFTLYRRQLGRNFFGTAKVRDYHPNLEPKDVLVTMFLASLDGPSPEYRGPRVVGDLGNVPPPPT